MTRALDGRGEQPRQRGQVVGAEDDVQVRQLLHELLAVALTDAASHGDVALLVGRAVSHGNVLHGCDLAVEPRIGGLAHAAGHEHDDIGLFNGADGQRAQPLEHAGDALGVVLVHLAAEGVDAESSALEGNAHGNHRL